jgi:predicted transcriptional regulator
MDVSENLAATVLDHIPGEGTTVPRLADEIKADPSSIETALEQLLQLQLIQRSGDLIHSTPFAQKARGFFKFVS